MTGNFACLFHQPLPRNDRPPFNPPRTGSAGIDVPPQVLGGKGDAGPAEDVVEQL